MLMPLSLVPTFLYYLLISGITPGPANLCSLSTSLKYGRKVAIRQWKGLMSGFWIITIISVFITYFIGNALNKYVHYFSFVGAAYLIYLGIHMLKEEAAEERAEAKAKDFSPEGESTPENAPDNVPDEVETIGTSKSIESKRRGIGKELI